MDSLFHRSKREKMKLELIYIDHEGVMSQRVMRVVDIREDYVIAYCFERKKVRRFTKSRMLAVLPFAPNKKKHGA